MITVLLLPRMFTPWPLATWTLPPLAALPPARKTTSPP
jgi:hypothetical protein